jgi:hypothetical protein
VSIAVETGTWITGLVGPIPYGCLMVSKMPSGGHGFGLRGVWVDMFAGYLYDWRFRQMG